MKPTLLILAAGMGSRYGGLKQIEPVGKNGETIIDYSIYDAINSGLNKIVFVVRKDIEKEFRDIIGKKYEDKISVDYTFQELSDIPNDFNVPKGRTKPWGTGHAILCARALIDSNFAVINGDDFYGKESFQALADYLNNVDKKSNDYAIVAYKLQNTLSEHGHVSRGVCSTNSENYLKNIVEYTRIIKSGERISSIDEYDAEVELSGNEYVSMNMFGFTPEIFTHLDREFNEFLIEKAGDAKSEFFIPTVVNNLIKSGIARVKALQTNSAWLGVTYQEDKEHVIKSIASLIDNKQYPQNLLE